MIDVIWYGGSRGNWDSGLLLETFDKYPEIFIQHNVQKAISVERAIVIVVGRPEVTALREYLETIKSGLVILTSEEDGFLDWKAAIPAHLELWTQYFTESKREIKERILLGAPNRLKDYKINSHLPKKYLWSFVGQVQNEFRQQCVDVLKNLPAGFLHIVPQFGGGEGGIEYQEYLDICCQSKFVICPSGSMVVESFRVYEAMECGAVPITEVRCPRDKFDFNYWGEVYPDNRLVTFFDWIELHKFKKFDFNYWDEITQLTWENYMERRNGWWFNYKKQLEQKLLNYAQGKND